MSSRYGRYELTPEEEALFAIPEVATIVDEYGNHRVIAHPDNGLLQGDLIRRRLRPVTEADQPPSYIYALTEVLQSLEAANIEVESVSLHRPTLDDVFMSLTGHVATKEEAETDMTDTKTKGKS